MSSEDLPPEVVEGFNERHQDWLEGKESIPEKPDHLSQIENPTLGNNLVIVEGVISSTSLSYFTPKEALATNYNSEGEKEEEIHIPVDSEHNIKFVNIGERNRDNILLNIAGLKRGLNVRVTNNRLVYKVRLRPPVFTLEKKGGKILDEQGYEYKPYDVYIVSEKPLELKASERIILEGKSLPDPKSQKATLMAPKIYFPDAVRGFNKERLAKLYDRFQDKTVKERVDWILENFEYYSHIVGRKNLAYASLLGFFSTTWINFDGDTQRGWVIILLVGDTTTGKSETVKKLIKLLQGGTYITAETASAVGLTGAAQQAEGGDWYVDWGFLPLNNERALIIDGSHRLSAKEWSKTAEAEREGKVHKSTAAKGSAPARTRQIKLANPIDPNKGKDHTKAVSEFLRPIQAVSTILDPTSIARIDLVAISDKRDVEISEINKRIEKEHDPDLELLSEALKWTWSKHANHTFTDEAIDYLLEQGTELYHKFNSRSIPLIHHNIKWKLARLSTALANLTLSTSPPDFDQVLVTKEHIEEVVRFLEEEYTETGLAAQAKTEEFAKLEPEDVADILVDLGLHLQYDFDKTIEMVRWIADTGGFTKDQLKAKFMLSRDNQLNPIVAELQNLELVDRGRGFTPAQKIIQMYKLLAEDEEKIKNLAVNYKPPDPTEEKREGLYEY